MKTIYIVRHAKAEPGTPGMRDFDRPLSPTGQQEAAQMAALLRARGVAPELLVSSPANRAHATALFFAKAFDIPAQELALRAEIYDAGRSALLEVVGSLPEPVQTACLFGHNPGLSDLAYYLGPDLMESLPTCGVVQIDSSAARWMDVEPANCKLAGHWNP
ncbi:MAG: SixA phosphatase family protein [Saprospiraceae bacterium]